MILAEVWCEGVDGFRLVQDRDQWRACGHSESLKSEDFFGQLSDCYLVKKVSALCTYLCIAAHTELRLAT
jgi:hypothetical protein